MANLTRKNWPLGWRPDFDAINGNPDGLLRMDNLRIDKDGIIGLIDGQKRISTSYSDFVENMFTKIINNVEYFWVSTGATGTTVSRTTSSFQSSVSLALATSGLNNNRGIFSDGLGYVFALAGAMRTKDPVVTPPVPLGLLTPVRLTSNLGPDGTANSPGILTIPAPTLALIGTSPASGQVTVDPSNFIGVISSPSNISVDTTQIGSTGIRTRIANDIVQIPVTILDVPPAAVKSIEINFILDGDPSQLDTYENYYTFVFDASVLPTGVGTRTVLSAKRGQFSRIGNNQELDWTTVIGVRAVVTATAVCTMAVFDISFYGGLAGGLNGTYNYIQVNVSDNGHYIAKSPASPPSDNFTLINGSVLLTAIDNEPNANEFWFFRKSVGDVGIDPNTGQPLNASVLDQYYFVGKIVRGSGQADFLDVLSDDDVLQINVDGSLLPNLNLLTLSTRDPINGLQDTIFDIEGIYRERMLYMGASQVYLSDRLNPDAIDTRFTLRPSGDATEVNLWLKKLTNNVIILATNKTLYEISGTLLESPDGTIDANLIDIGEAHPPISVDVCNFDGSLFYIAADGLRTTRGSNSTNVSPQLRHLFSDVKVNSAFAAGGAVNSMRHGVPGVAIYQAIGVNYSIAVCHNKIYMILPMQDGTRRLLTYDLITHTYSLMFTDPQKVFATQSDELIAGYGAGASNTLYILDYLAGYGRDGNGIPFTLRTVFDDNGQPRNRKDTFTLKLVMETGGDFVSVQIGKDGAGITEFDEPVWTNLGQYQSTANAGPTTFYIKLDSLDPGFRYSLQLTQAGAGVKTFKLYEYSIEYEPRPEQRNYLRILPTNLGTISRKRITAFAFTIDTLGTFVTFTPYLDNVAWTSSETLQTGTKLTYIFYFASEAIATDIGGILSAPLLGGKFEFYGLNLEECVSEKLPVPTKYLIIPNDNYGTPNRKRHTSYKFQINTRSQDVTFTPYLDGVSYIGTTFNTATRRTVEYFFPYDSDIIGTDIGGILASVASTPFEFYGNVRPQTVEVLPDQLKYLRIPNSNLGLAARKRIRTLSLVLDTFGLNVVFSPLVDGVAQTSVYLNSNGKRTVYYYFTSDVIGTDFGGVLDGVVTGNVFEFYSLGTPDNVEALPQAQEFLVIPNDNYGTPNRKRHTSYKFQIDTHGFGVVFTPILDGVAHQALTVETSERRTVEYFFPQSDGDVIGIDIGGTLSGVAPFEFYGNIKPQTVEVLPDQLEYLRIPNTNFGVAARKRIRTLPIVIDTFGQNVTFTPVVDGQLGTPQTLNTNGKTTTYYYFNTDSFGTDYGGIISTGPVFEFYDLLRPEDVEILPVPKLLDQLGPLQLDKIGKLFGFRIRIIPTGTTTQIPWAIYDDFSPTIPNNSNALIGGVITVVPNYDNIYEIQFPKSVNMTICRLVIGATTDPFHRYEVKLKVAISGMESESKWLSIR